MIDWIFSVESVDGREKCGHQHFLKAAAEECKSNYERRYRKKFNVLHWSYKDLPDGNRLVVSTTV